MRISDILYFAPGVRFSDVDLEGPGLPDQLRQRILGFYIEPAIECCGRGEAFAAGVILVSCIDALARFSSKETEVTPELFKRFVRKELPSFGLDDSAKRLYEEVRCGLVHEARLKNGAQFSLKIDTDIQESANVLIVNPARLADEVQDALERYIAALKSDERQRGSLAARLMVEYERDFIVSGSACWLEEGEGPEDWS